MFLHQYFYKILYLLACCYYFLTSNMWASLMFVLNPLKLNRNLHNEIVNNKSTLFLTLINNWKKPNHLVLIIGEDVILYNDITQIILWCMIAGVSFVSVYDYKNRLSQYNLMSAIKSNPLFEEINKLTFGFSFNTLSVNSKSQNTMVLNSSKLNAKPEINGINKYYADDITSILTLIEECKKKGQTTKNKHFLKNEINRNGYFEEDFKNALACCCNGNGQVDFQENTFDQWCSKMLSSNRDSSSSTKTELNVLSRKQCEDDLLNTIIELSERKVDLNSTLIEKKLQEKCPLPDPDVGIIIGSKFSSYGLLPWHIRLTEFFQFHNYQDISINKFNYILKKFSKCEQRYGK